MEDDFRPKTIPVRRPLTSQEKTWVNEIVSANEEWADIDIPELFTVGMCSCGCRSFDFERTSEPQNPTFAGRQGDVGILYIITKDDHVITIILFHQDGFLSGLDVIWEMGEPMPERWEEARRILSVDGKPVQRHQLSNRQN